MRDRLFKSINNIKICIIRAGFEEYDYINKLNELKVWCNDYEITPINAEGAEI